ncbi:MAG TPA: S1/P1 nuclease [Planctomycetota bacterium]|nr:S1/P1 nuclease [Planctomycetota bacterium]
MSPERRASLSAGVFALALLRPGAAGAWSSNGHRVIGLIAQSLLQEEAQRGDQSSQAALGAVSALLGPGVGLSDVAPCADLVRDLGKEPDRSGEEIHFHCGGLVWRTDPLTLPWHFVDIPITAADAADSIDAHCGDDCVVAQIKKDVLVLQDPASLLPAKREALMFLVHFVGDEHQPLHCATEIVDGQDDRGGNDKKVKFDGQPLNMHALWDHLIQTSDGLNDPVPLAERLTAQLPPGATSQWTQGDFVADAALESLAIAQRTIYPAYYAAARSSVHGRRRRAAALPADYQSRMEPIVEERLQKAGVRLAVLLKRALANAGALSTGGPAVRKASKKLQPVH